MMPSSEWRAQVMSQIDSATSKVDRDVWLPLPAFLSSADNAWSIRNSCQPISMENPLMNSKENAILVDEGERPNAEESRRISQ
jgi:hypothetical protein